MTFTLLCSRTADPTVLKLVHDINSSKGHFVQNIEAFGFKKLILTAFFDDQMRWGQDWAFSMLITFELKMKKCSAFWSTWNYGILIYLKGTLSWLNETMCRLRPEFIKN